MKRSPLGTIQESSFLSLPQRVRRMFLLSTDKFPFVALDCITIPITKLIPYLEKTNSEGRKEGRTDGRTERTQLSLQFFFVCFFQNRKARSA